MNRRSFLAMAGFVAPAVIVKPTYFFAPPGGWGVKLYSTIGAWADYPRYPIRVSYDVRFIANLEAVTPFETLVTRKTM